MITLIAAISEFEGKYVIGKDGDLPWRKKKGSKSDMDHFKKLTSGGENSPGHPVIMGRKTWDSIPTKYRPLEGRVNYILTRNKDFELDYNSKQNAEISLCYSLQDALDKIENQKPHMENINYDDVFIMGGSSLYEEGLERAHRLELTFFNEPYAGDTFFPEFSKDEWMIVAGEKKNHVWFKRYEKRLK
tara:strand:- start:16125 stop:16688 length:564 start_codon:yes stop_codon:yes gene_type:complete